MFRFSQELRTRAKAYFGKLYEREITDAEADEFLRSLANLYNNLFSSLHD